jgi:hypothetical protein
MKIKHHPNIGDVQKVVEYYSEKDKVEVKYVCTTDLIASDVSVDVFYRNTPHPEFGNRYFGLYYDSRRDAMMICNADMVETFEFGVVENDKGELEYSQSHHDYKMFENGNMIDGGRVYIRTSKGCDVYQIKDGEFVQNVGDNTMGDLKFTTAKDYVYPGGDCQI